MQDFFGETGDFVLQAVGQGPPYLLAPREDAPMFVSVGLTTLRARPATLWAKAPTAATTAAIRNRARCYT